MYATFCNSNNFPSDNEDNYYEKRMNQINEEEKSNFNPTNGNMKRNYFNRSFSDLNDNNYSLKAERDTPQFTQKNFNPTFTYQTNNSSEERNKQRDEDNVTVQELSKNLENLIFKYTDKKFEKLLTNSNNRNNNDMSSNNISNNEYNNEFNNTISYFRPQQCTYNLEERNSNNNNNNINNNNNQLNNSTNNYNKNDPKNMFLSSNINNTLLNSTYQTNLSNSQQQEDLNNTKNSLLKCTELISILKQENETLKDQNNSAINAIASQKNTTNLNKLQNDELTKENVNLRNRLTEAERTIQEQKEMIDELKKNTQILEKKVLYVQQENEISNLNIHKNDNDFANELKRLNLKIQDLMREKELLIERFNTENQQKDQTIKNLSELVDEANDQIEDLEDQLTSMKRFDEKQQTMLDDLYKFYTEINKMAGDRSKSRGSVRGSVRGSIRGSIRPSIRGSIRPSIRGSINPRASSGSVKGSVRGSINQRGSIGGARPSIKPRGSLNPRRSSNVRNSLSPGGSVNERKSIKNRQSLGNNRSSIRGSIYDQYDTNENIMKLSNDLFTLNKVANKTDTFTKNKAFRGSILYKKNAILRASQANIKLPSRQSVKRGSNVSQNLNDRKNRESMAILQQTKNFYDTFNTTAGRKQTIVQPGDADLINQRKNRESMATLQQTRNFYDTFNTTAGRKQTIVQPGDADLINQRKNRESMATLQQTRNFYDTFNTTAGRKQTIIQTGGAAFGNNRGSKESIPEPIIEDDESESNTNSKDSVRPNKASYEEYRKNIGNADDYQKQFGDNINIDNDQESLVNPNKNKFDPYQKIDDGSYLNQDTGERLANLSDPSQTNTNNNDNMRRYTYQTDSNNKYLNDMTFTTPEEVLDYQTPEQFRHRLSSLRDRFGKALDEDYNHKFGRCFACDIACCTSEVDRLKYYRHRDPEEIEY